MTRPADDKPPYLHCPECDCPIFPATLRGFSSDDGEFIEHSETCRCPTCDWGWREDESATCECGAYCVVGVDDGIAYVAEVEP